MKISIRVLYLVGLQLAAAFSNAFLVAPDVYRRVSVPMRVSATTQEDGATVTASKPKVQQLGLLTFDLDDTLYPIEPVVKAANGKTQYIFLNMN